MSSDRVFFTKVKDRDQVFQTQYSLHYAKGQCLWTMLFWKYCVLQQE